MIRVAIIDDEPLARRGLAARLAAHPDLQLVGDYADAAAAAEGLSRYPADLVLLDVQMPGMSGLDLLRSLAGARPPLAILFTAHAHYAVDAFALDVVDYLLKPLDDARLDAALRRARQRLRALAAPPAAEAAPAAWVRSFEVRVGRCTRLVRVEELEWLQAEGDYVALHTRSGSHLLRQTLARMQEQLDPALFLRVHRSSIVRLDAVAELRALSNRDALLRLHSGTLVRASRGYVDALRARLRGTG
ncbi:LytR/AlgR family response regulator transcription factor [Xanthomonas medicagonis]|uniref:LytR/AlgR family response regulator transcription factor n=1 Tax=Xanthomonas medicagonis TaxID=3160841 RepID=UPI00351445A9